MFLVTILVVEDNKHTRLLTEARLKKIYHVVTAENGSQALDIFYERQIDLIVVILGYIFYIGMFLYLVLLHLYFWLVMIKIKNWFCY